MRLGVSYKYTENEILPRCRKLQLVRHEGEIVVTIREITWEEAPIAIIGRSYWDNTATIYRWFGRKLWVCVDDRGEPLGPVSNDLFYVPPHKGQADAIKELRAKARNVLLIDGQRWCPAGEPRYVVMTFGLGHNHGLGWGTSLSVSDWYNPNIGASMYFRIDQYREALAETERIARARGDTKALPVEGEQHPDTFEILIPEAIRLRPNKQHGAGDPFLNSIEKMIEATPDSVTAGIGALAILAHEIAK